MLVGHVVTNDLLPERLHALRDTGFFLAGFSPACQGEGWCSGFFCMAAFLAVAGCQALVCSPITVRGMGTKPGSASIRASQLRTLA